MCNFEFIDRSTKRGFTLYMQHNPVYFWHQFGLPATPDNIIKAYHAAMRARKRNPFRLSVFDSFTKIKRSYRRMAA